MGFKKEGAMARMQRKRRERAAAKKAKPPAKKAAPKARSEAGKSFSETFAAERKKQGSRGTFSWTDPKTGKTDKYTTRRADDTTKARAGAKPTKVVKPKSPVKTGKSTAQQRTAKAASRRSAGVGSADARMTGPGMKPKAEAKPKAAPRPRRSVSSARTTAARRAANRRAGNYSRRRK